eukprot:scaffold96135_cov57-Phaeocystis_antarctica.AAC.1
MQDGRSTTTTTTTTTVKLYCYYYSIPRLRTRGGRGSLAWPRGSSSGRAAGSPAACRRRRSRPG